MRRNNNLVKRERYSIQLSVKMHQDEESLLSYLQKGREELGLPEGGLSSVLFCGKIKSELDIDSVMETHKAVIESENDSGLYGKQIDDENEKVEMTGILLRQGLSVIHLIEGPSIAVLRTLQKLAEHPDFHKDNKIQEATIVHTFEDHPKRTFKKWFSATIPDRKTTDELTEENCNDIAFDLFNKLSKVAASLEMDKWDGSQLLSFCDHLPGAKLIMAMGATTHFFSLEQFVQFYVDAYDVELPSEESWPVEDLICY